jgi:excisionase family DNA binding protein
MYSQLDKRPLAVRQPTAEQFLQTVAAAARAPEPDVRLAERLFLTIREAGRYSGLPQSHLRELIRSRKLKALKTGAGWRIRRADLEQI